MEYKPDFTPKPERNRLIVLAADAREPYRSIGARFGISAQRVKAIVLAAARRGEGKPSKRQFARYRAMQHRSAWDLAPELRVRDPHAFMPSDSRWQRLLRTRRLAQRTIVAAPGAERAAAVARLDAQGVRTKEIARMLGIGMDQVCQARHYGTKKPRRKSGPGLEVS